MLTSDKYVFFWLPRVLLAYWWDGRVRGMVIWRFLGQLGWRGDGL